MDASTQTVAEVLLAWYQGHARRLPWRAPPGAPPPDPYRVWLSEVMLQQTTVAAVAPYFVKFTARWPTARDLAAAEDAEVMAAWAGLGYYARARNLLACARAVAARGGAFPDTEEALRELPGLGAYTAAAVAAIAFGRRAVVVDANVERVTARLFALDEPLPGGRTAIRRAAEAITPERHSGDFAQAMMDLGATICTSRAPRCLLCPLAAACQARARGEAERFPVKAAKKPRPERHGRAYWIEREGAVWLVRREGRGMLGGMRALPDDDWSARSDGARPAPLVGPWTPLGTVQHVFTHFALTLSLSLYDGDDWARLDPDEGEWWSLDQLEAAGLPTLFAKAARLGLSRQRGE
ncbi:MAG: A/G-specific adenine glycosylase [Sphingomonadales bacterium]|nr:A/G-specific adenine glycosylase [Sphingomonadales bacterium]